MVDTNVLGLTSTPWTVDWPEIVGYPKTRVVLPLRVIEELDKYKYGGEDKRIAKIAPNLLSRLEQRLAESKSGCVEVSENIVIEVLIARGERDRTLHADEEILRRCEDLMQFAGGQVTLVSDDTTVRLQARARGIHSIGVEQRFADRVPRWR